MKQFITQHGLKQHPEIAFACDTHRIPHEDVEWLLNLLESEIQLGRLFKAGEILNIGWVGVKLAPENSSTLRILEPDFRGLPINFIPSVNHTLKHYRQHLDTVASLKPQLELEMPSVRDSIIVSKNFAASQHLRLWHETPKKAHESGWFCKDLTVGDKDAYNQLSLYEFACLQPSLIKYLALPIHSEVIWESGRSMSISYKNQALSILPNSYLEAVNQAKLN
ncbi:MAG: hypothetical protein AAGB12_15750 [Pseudomonadota bacterium]